MPYSGSTGLMTQMRDEFDRLFDRFLRHWPGMGLMRGGEQGWNWGWGLDVRDEDNAVTVRAELPGFDADDINLQVADNRLVIRAAHKSESGQGKGQGRAWQQREYYQAVTVPSGIDADKSDASYRNGVLTVHMPKTEKAKGRRVTIRKE
jgi:HSP20 family protein